MRQRDPTVLNRLDLRGRADLATALARPSGEVDEPVEAVRAILADVRARGDAAVLEATERFDGVALAQSRVGADEIEAALDEVPPAVREALEVAAANIERFHRAQRRDGHEVDNDGIVIRERFVPVDRAGLYVPGGRAAYPSTVLMTAIPARVAGVDDLVLCVPPDRTTGRVAAVTLAAARIAGVGEVHAVGGAQAIAAMAYGTESIRAVDVIAGPGNLYVAVAKREVAGEVGVAAAFAGPSEIVVVADASVDAELAAIDVLVQAEHGPDGMSWLLTWDPEVADAVAAEVERLAAAAPRRAEIEATLASNGWLALVDDAEQALAAANLIAPEHLQLMCEGAEQLAERVRHAGAVFCGPWSPAAVGDYLAGPSHVLPTHRSARFGSALTVDDFVRQIHIVSLDEQALERFGPPTATLAEAEGLDAHAQAVRLRLDRLRGAGEPRSAPGANGGTS